MVVTLKFFSLLALASLVSAAPSHLKRQAQDPQTSLTLDPAVIMAHGLDDGQADTGSDAGQVPSLTSGNNFINFCLTQNVPITDGLQTITGSCNPTPMGRICAKDVMPESKFVFPKNGDTSLSQNQSFVIQMKIKNIVTGNFVNPNSKYYAAPQHVDEGTGHIIGHSHVVVQPIPSLDSTDFVGTLNFAFFKGLNLPDENGILSANVSLGLLAGAYRLCSINAAANHQPALAPVAQHGSIDDCVYFTVGPPAAGGAANAAAPPAAAPPAAAPPAAAPPATNQAKTVVVKKGDNCFKIAKANGVSVKTILKLNTGVNKKCTNLQPGQTLTLA